MSQDPNQQTPPAAAENVEDDRAGTEVPEAGQGAALRAESGIVDLTADSPGENQNEPDSDTDGPTRDADADARSTDAE